MQVGGVEGPSGRRVPRQGLRRPGERAEYATARWTRRYADRNATICIISRRRLHVSGTDREGDEEEQCTEGDLDQLRRRTRTRLTRSDVFSTAASGSIWIQRCAQSVMASLAAASACPFLV